MCLDIGQSPDITAIQAAQRRIAARVPPTPAIRAWDLGNALGQPLWLKAENFQPTGSFKVRGATNWVASAGAEELASGLITVSAGNHASALAWAAGDAGVALTVVMPEGSSPLKIAATRRLGAEVIVQGSVQEAVAHTRELAQQRQLTLVHPYDDRRVIAGQGTLGLELLEQIPQAARVLCPIGGGGLISGVGIAVKTHRPDIELIGVEPQMAATMRNAWDQRDAAAVLDRVDTIAASLAPAQVGAYTYTASRAVVDDIVCVSEAAIAEATRRLLTGARVYAETGCSVGLAALLDNRVAIEPQRPTVLVITGGNMDPSQAVQLLQRVPS